MMTLGTRAADRRGGISGIATLVLTSAGFGLMAAGGMNLDPTTPQGKIAEFVSKRPSALVPSGLFLDMLGGIFLIVFAVRLWARLRASEGPPGTMSAIALAGAVLSLAAAAGDKDVFYAMTALAGKGLDPNVARGLVGISSGSFVVFGFYTALLTGAASVVAFRTRALPRWVAWVGVLSAAGSVLTGAAPGAQAGIGLFDIWLLGTSIAMLRRRVAVPAAIGAVAVGA
jgi:hypothetical protein